MDKEKIKIHACSKIFSRAIYCRYHSKKRKTLKKSQDDIANVLGVTVGYIGQIESKKLKSIYSYDQLNELAKFFNSSPKDFMPEKPIEE